MICGTYVANDSRYVYELAPHRLSYKYRYRSAFSQDFSLWSPVTRNEWAYIVSDHELTLVLPDLFDLSAAIGD